MGNCAGVIGSIIADLGVLFDTRTVTSLFKFLWLSSYRLLLTDILDLITQLVDKSLVVAETKGTETRYRLLETIRQYAREKLFDSGEVERIRNRHLDFYAKFAEYAEPRTKGAEQLIWFDKLEIEHDNLRAAIGWATESGQVEAGFRIMNGIKWFWNWRGYWSEGRECLIALLSCPEVATKTMIRARILAEIARFCFLLGMLDSGDKFADEAITLARELGERQVLARALWAKGLVMGSQGDTTAAEECNEEALALFRQVGDKFSIAFVLANRGVQEREQGKTRLARASLEEALAVDREIGNEMGASWHGINLGPLVYYQGDYAFAQALFEENLAIERKFGRKRGIAAALRGLGLVATAQGDYSAARSLLQDSLDLSRELGEKHLAASDLDHLSRAARLEGDLATARSLAEEDLKLSHEMGGKLREADALASLGQIALAQGDYATARTLFEESLAIRQQRNAKLDIPSAMQSLGNVSFLQGDDAQARAQYENGLALAKEMELKPVIAYSLRMLGYLELHAGNTARAEELFKESFQFNVERKLKIGMIRGLPTFAALALARVHASRERAARLLGATQALLEPMHAHLESVDDTEYKRSVAAAREQLGEATFNAAWEEGKQMTLEQAVKYALENVK